MGSAAAAPIVAAAVVAAALIVAGVAAAATEQQNDEDDPQAGIITGSVVKAHERSPRFKILRYSMRQVPEWGLTA